MAYHRMCSAVVIVCPPFDLFLPRQNCCPSSLVDIGDYALYKYIARDYY